MEYMAQPMLDVQATAQNTKKNPMLVPQCTAGNYKEVVERKGRLSDTDRSNLKAQIEQASGYVQVPTEAPTSPGEYFQIPTGGFEVPRLPIHRDTDLPKAVPPIQEARCRR